MPLETRTARIGDTAIAYQLRLGRRRRGIALAIDERGLIVSAPYRTGMGTVEAALREHGDWIARKLAEWSAKRPRPVEWVHGAQLVLHGAPLRLELHAGIREPRREGDRLIAGAGDAPELIRTQVIAWMQAEALHCFRDRVDHYRRLLDLPVPAVSLTRARTRWGSCSPGARIRLNWRLIQMPPDIVDYVVAHEVAHLREMNHSARFWDTVAILIPDHHERRRRLRTSAQQYLVL